MYTKLNQRITEESQKKSSKDVPKLPFLSRNSTRSLNTRGMPQTICPSSFRVSKATPNTHLAASSGSETRVGAMGSGLTLALGLRILTEDGSLCMERRHAPLTYFNHIPGCCFRKSSEGLSSKNLPHLRRVICDLEVTTSLLSGPR